MIVGPEGGVDKFEQFGSGEPYACSGTDYEHIMLQIPGEV